MPIEFQNVSKWFPHSMGRQLLRTHIARWFVRVHNEPFCALRNVSFQLGHGESLALVGSNGAGKSTLLSLAAGLTPPDQGKVLVQGRIAALLELGSGFHPDLTGAENLVLNAALLGLSKRQTSQLFDRIVEFSGIGEFIDDPLRTYSSGMRVRLAFAVSTAVDAEILLLDEVMGVGDASFMHKAEERLADLHSRAEIVVLAMHSNSEIRKVCNKALWMERGHVRAFGPVEEVVSQYETQD